MSITDDQKEVVNIGTVHAWIFKASLWAAPLLCVWLVNKVLAHDTDIALLKLELAMSRKAANGISQSVNVGKAAEEMAPESARTWLTTQEVAKRELVTDRTILNYIEAGMINPAPTRTGKDWRISENYRIVPNDSESCGIDIVAKVQR